MILLLFEIIMENKRIILKSLIDNDLTDVKNFFKK